MDGASRETARERILAQYRPVRASIRVVLREAVGHCRKPDLDRAAKQLGLWDQGQLDDSDILDMLSDIALMEPNQRGRRAYDRFLACGAASLQPGDRAMAERMAGAFFSIFRVAGWHETAGVWLDDLLTPDRRHWLVDEGLEASAPEGLTVAMRVFDAGPFHAGFGIVVVPGEEFAGFCVTAASRGDRLPVRNSLAAALYAEEIVRSSVSGLDGGIELG